MYADFLVRNAPSGLQSSGNSPVTAPQTQASFCHVLLATWKIAIVHASLQSICGAHGKQ
jgi:hypothetical protein